MPIELSAGAKHQLASLRSNLPEYLEFDSHVALDATQKISSTELTQLSTGNLQGKAYERMCKESENQYQ